LALKITNILPGCIEKVDYKLIFYTFNLLTLPGLPLTGNGIYSETAVRGLLDFYAWIGRLEEPELKLIRNTRLAWADVYLGKMERGGGWADPRINIRLPVSLREGAGTTPSFGGGGGG
jgi:hypothetical protein